MGKPRRRQRNEHAQLFSIGLLLVAWAAIYRMVWTACWGWGDVADGWLEAEPGAVAIAPMCAAVILGLAAMNAGAFLDPANRTRGGIALGVSNMAFVAVLAAQFWLDTTLADQLRSHRLSGARSDGNLAREVRGEWNIARSTGRPPADLGSSALALAPDGSIRAFLEGSWQPVDALWEVEGIDQFTPELALCRGPLARWCERDSIAFLREFHVGEPLEPPALVLHGRWDWQRWRDEGSRYSWIADLRDPAWDRLSLRAVTWGPHGVELGRLELRRRSEREPVAGRDLGAELAVLRDVYSR